MSIHEKIKTEKFLLSDEICERDAICSFADEGAKSNARERRRAFVSMSEKIFPRLFEDMRREKFRIKTVDTFRRIAYTLVPRFLALEIHT